MPPLPASLSLAALALAVGTPSQAQLDRWYECQGRSFGYVQLSARSIDFYNLYFNCPRLVILSRRSVMTRTQPRTTELLVVDNRSARRDCPFTVFAWSAVGGSGPPPQPPVAIDLHAYEDMAQFERIDAGVGVNEAFSCAAYLVDGDGPPQIVPPQGRHARSVRDQLRDRAARHRLTAPSAAAAPRRPAPLPD